MGDPAGLDPLFLTLPIAHRGLHDRDRGRVENTRAACQAAIDAGFGIEIDIQPSADGVPMVFHDDVLDRLTGTTGRVAERTADELSKIAVTGGGETIPTLAEVLDLVAGRLPLLIEIKDQDGALGPDVGPLPKAVASALVGYVGPVAVMSFNPHAVAEFALHAPEIAHGLVTEAFRADDWPDVPAQRRAELAALAGFDETGASFVSCGRRDLDRPPIAALKARGMPVLTWTIRSQQQEAEARAFADNITFEGYRPRVA